MTRTWRPIHEAVRAAAGESCDRADVVRAQLTAGRSIHEAISRPSGASAAALRRAIERCTGEAANAWAKARRIVEFVGTGDEPLAKGLPWASAVALCTEADSPPPPPPWVPVVASDGHTPVLATKADLVVLPSLPDEAVWPLALAARSWLASGGLLWSACGLASARAREVLPALGFAHIAELGNAPESCWHLEGCPADSRRGG